MPYYGDGSSYYYGNPFANHSSLMTGTGRPFNVQLVRFSPHLSTISESPLSNLRRYSPVTITRRPRRTIDTADIDVSTPRTLTHESTHQRHNLRRDRPTIKIRSQALKDNPALREHYEKHEKNVGEMLVEKFLIKEKKYDRDSNINLSPQPNLDRDSTNALAEAIQRRVTRRFTRRRSSADVQLNSEQLERELAYAQVQAEVLDTLVAEEQAEMEVEARKAFAKKKTHRPAHNLPQVEIIQTNESVFDDDDEEVSRIRKKVKKKKKSFDNHLPTNNDQEVFTQSVTEDSDSKVESKEENEKPGIQKFKVEACNSVGDFSTLWINTSPAEATSVRPTEQFRESIRLPAPKRLPVSNLETETKIVLPVPKTYVRDNSRNSVYLTLKKTEKSEEDFPEGFNQSKMSNDTGVTIEQSKVAKIDAKDTIESSVEVKNFSDTLAVSLARKVHTQDVRKSLNANADVLSDAIDLNDCSENNVTLESEKKIECDLKDSNLELNTRPSITPTELRDDVIIDKTASLTDCSLTKESTVPDLPKREGKVIQVKSPKEEAESGKESVITDDTNSSSLALKEETLQKDKSPTKSPSRPRFKPLKNKTSEKLEKVSSAEEIKLTEVPSKGKAFSKENTPRLESPIRAKLDSKDSSLKSHPERVSSPSNEIPTDGIKSPGLSIKDRSLSKESTCSLDSQIITESGTQRKPLKLKSSSPSNEVLKTAIKSPELLVSPPESPLRKNKSSKDSSPSSPIDATSKSPGIPDKSPGVLSKSPTRSKFTFKNSSTKSPLAKVASLNETKSPELSLNNKPFQKDLPVLESQKKKLKIPRNISPITIEEEITPTNEVPLKAVDTPESEVSSEIDFWSEIKSEKKTDKSEKNTSKSEKITDNSEKSMNEFEKVKSKLGELQEVSRTDIIKKAEAVVPEQEAEMTKAAEMNNGNAKESEETRNIKLNGIDRKLSKSLEPLDLNRVRESLKSFDSPSVSFPTSEVSTPLSEVSQPNLSSEGLSLLSTDTSILDDDDGLATPTNESITKMTKWNRQDNLSNLTDLEKDLTTLPMKKMISSTTSSPSDSTKKKKKVIKRKKSSTKSDKNEIDSVKSSSKLSKKKGFTPDSTIKMSNARSSPRDAPCRPSDLMRIFYTTPRQLLTATPRDLRKVRRAKVKKRKPPPRNASVSSDSTGSTTSTQSTTTSTEDGCNSMDELEQKRMASTRSNDSGFDGSPRLSNCDMACHKKCEKLTGNLCGLNQKLVAEALQAVKRGPYYVKVGRRSFVRRRLRAFGDPFPSTPSQSLENHSSDHFHTSGRITPPATNLPRFKKYAVTDFNFLKVLGKGSFGKVLLAELRGTECIYAVKCLKKDVVLEDDDVECTLIERKVLTLATRHPYLCHLFCTFQTESHLFFVMEYLNGGDLMFHIQKSGRFSEPRARFYAAEIWSGLNFLHKKGIVYRDLKLDNVLLDFEGHIRIADFGMCKLQIFLDRTADTFCGTPDYMAPEIIKGLKYNQAVDWWSFGVLLYEMLTGQSPFSGCDEEELFWSICNERPFIPRYLSQDSTSMLICLLEKDSGKRLPAHEIAVHPFFQSVPWDKLERRQLEAPFKPAVEHTLDTRYFDTAFTAERPRLTAVPEDILTSMDQNVFRGFSYTNPNATD